MDSDRNVNGVGVVAEGLGLLLEVPVRVDLNMEQNFALKPSQSNWRITRKVN